MYSKYQEIMGSHFPVAIAPRGDCSPHPNPRDHLPLEARFAAGFWSDVVGFEDQKIVISWRIY
jgi:hypothetical protein